MATLKTLSIVLSLRVDLEGCWLLAVVDNFDWQIAPITHL